MFFRSLVLGSSESSMMKKRNSDSGIKLNEEVQDTNNNDWDCDDGENNDFSLIGDDFDPQTGHGVIIDYLFIIFRLHLKIFFFFFF